MTLSEDVFFGARRQSMWCHPRTRNRMIGRVGVRWERGNMTELGPLKENTGKRSSHKVCLFVIIKDPHKSFECTIPQEDFHAELPFSIDVPAGIHL